MASSYISESGRLLEEAKRAAYEAVNTYTAVTPYTVGVAVQAAMNVLRTGTAMGLEPSAPPALTPPFAIDVHAVEVTPRLRVLESVARAAMAAHPAHEDTCPLCEALLELDDLEAAG